jgi:DNA-binding CsgD family transcriptional regulator
MQCQIILETLFERRKRAEVAPRLGISEHTYDNHVQDAFRS